MATTTNLPFHPMARIYYILQSMETNKPTFTNTALQQKKQKNIHKRPKVNTHLHLPAMGNLFQVYV